MKYLCQVLAIAWLTFAQASVLINIIDNGTKEITNLANGSLSSNLDPDNTNKLTTCNAKSCVFSCQILNFSDGRCKDDICECIRVYKLRQNDINKSQHIDVNVTSFKTSKVD
ncbi:unnamed protein product, partial [Iphiclides podalirius]